jgi:ornithine carbamoyltransferase
VYLVHVSACQKQATTPSRPYAAIRPAIVPPDPALTSQELAKYSPVPVINALSSLYHPTQILADLLTMHETYAPAMALPSASSKGKPHSSLLAHLEQHVDPLEHLKGKKVAWVGDTNNIINEMLVTLPRLGMTVSVASPKGYDQVDERVWARV